MIIRVRMLILKNIFSKELIKTLNHTKKKKKTTRLFKTLWDHDRWILWTQNKELWCQKVCMSNWGKSWWYGLLWSDLGNVYDLSHLLTEKTMMHQVWSHTFQSIGCLWVHPMARWPVLDFPPKRYLVRYHALSSDRFSQEELRGLLLNQSRELIQGWTHCGEVAQSFLEGKICVYLNSDAPSIKWKS